MANQYTVKKLLDISEKHWPESVGPAHNFAIYISRLRDLDFIKIQKELKQKNLSITEFDVLASLRRSTSPHFLTPGEIQKATLLSSGGLTKIIYNLEDKKLVKCSIKIKDKRSKFVYLTKKGKQLIESSMKNINETYIKLLNKALSAKDLHKLNSFLRKVLDSLEHND